MGRRNLYEILDECGVDPKKEYKRLWHLVNSRTISFHRSDICYFSYINIFLFTSLPLRTTANDLSELLEDLELDDECDSIDDLFLLSELLLITDPAIYPLMDIEEPREAAIRLFKHIYSNIQEICRKTNHEISYSNKKPIIVESNKLTSHAVEIIDDSSLAYSLIEYNHYAMKGHLNEKRKTLTQFGNYIEPILNEHVLQKAGFGKLESDAGFLLNNFHVRHNNKDGKKAQEFTQTLNDTQLEEWYDKIYNTLLSVIIIVEQIDINKELDGLKQQYRWK